MHFTGNPKCLLSSEILVTLLTHSTLMILITFKVRLKATLLEECEKWKIMSVKLIKAVQL